MGLSREQIKRIIIDEVLRALRELGIEHVTHQPSMKSFDYGSGVVVLSGDGAVDDTFAAAMFAIAGSGAVIEGLLSHSFRQAQAVRGPLALPGVKPLVNSDDEPATKAAISRSGWVILPDASFNTLAKLTLGIEDSVPSRAVAEALRMGRHVLFSESEREPSRRGDQRTALLRKLRSQGAVITSHAELPDSLRDAIDPPEHRPYVPLVPPKPAPPRTIITFEDVHEAWRAGRPELIVPVDAIITAEAREQAARRGLKLLRAGETA